MQDSHPVFIEIPPPRSCRAGAAQYQAGIGPSVPRSFQLRTALRLRAIATCRGLPLLLLFLLTTPPAAAQRDALMSWWQRTTEARSRFYTIRTDLPADEARPFADHLDRMYLQYLRRLGDLPPRSPEKLNVYIFSTQSEYVFTLRTRWQIDASGSAGMFFVKHDGDGLAFFTGDRSRQRILHTVQHEAFHQFAYSRFGGDLPPWLNEGLAELFGQGIPVGGDVRLGLPSARMVEAVRDVSGDGGGVQFAALLRMTEQQWNRQVREGRAAPLYHQAWSMVHFLIYGNGGRHRPMLERMLRLINNGTRFDHAFAEVFGDDVGAFEREWRSHAQSLLPNPFATAVERIEFLAEGSAALREQRIYPETLEDLKQRLREMSFVYAAEVHGMEVTLSAEDEENFLVPRVPGSEEGAVFVVRRPNLDHMLRRERIVEEEVPSPSIIETSDLAPVNLAVRWIRDERFAEFSYIIEAME